MNITLYTIGCPACQVLEKKLTAKEISFERVDDIDILKQKGIDVLPKLEVNGKLMGFAEANSWVNEQ